MVDCLECAAVLRLWVVPAGADQRAEEKKPAEAGQEASRADDGA